MPFICIKLADELVQNLDEVMQMLHCLPKPRLCLLLFIIFLAITISYGQENATQRPNILIIIPDDMGWADVGYHGSEIKTPNIDQLAHTGIRMEQHYVMPTCTPTRVSLMTGQYPSRYGITTPDYGEVIDLGDATLASLLAKNDYYTAIVGKWHMGSPPYTPLKYGFESSYGYFDGQIDPYTHEYKTGRKCWHRNDVLFDEDGHVTDLLTDETIRIIEEDRKEPFFIYLAHQVPHNPLNEPEEWTSLYDDSGLHPTRKLFAASISHMDDGIGEIVDALERTGKRENTLILFLSDNGGQHNWSSRTQYHGDYADIPHEVLGNNFPLRGWKGQVYEGGIRTPAFAHWNGTLDPVTINHPFHMTDWLPTLCELVGIEDELSDLSVDGFNIWPVLSGEVEALDSHPIYWKTNQSYAVRDGDWKLIVHRKTNESELYNLAKDFREYRDVSESNPQKLEHLTKLLKKYQSGDRE